MSSAEATHATLARRVADSQPPAAAELGAARSFNGIHLETMSKVDLFVLGDEHGEVGLSAG